MYLKHYIKLDRWLPLYYNILTWYIWSNRNFKHHEDEGWFHTAWALLFNNFFFGGERLIDFIKQK